METPLKRNCYHFFLQVAIFSALDIQDCEEVTSDVVNLVVEHNEFRSERIFFAFTVMKEGLCQKNASRMSFSISIPCPRCPCYLVSERFILCQNSLRHTVDLIDVCTCCYLSENKRDKEQLLNLTSIKTLCKV